MRRIELLAPARNLECGKAAIDHGADAVYIGPRRFGARAAAGNSVDDIAQLCSYAHQYGAKVYATVNTIIYDDEADEVRRLMDELDGVGVDAFLIQDLRLADMRHLTLHASTQTDNRTSERVAQLRRLGMKRVVLARELSLREIKAIHDDMPDMELEVFVHGALCVSYSGACYASQYCFGRSANRGECAQFCRLPFTLKDADGRALERNRHLLSLKDMCRISHLEELIQAGASSLKIEGRLKDVGYVKNVVSAYSQRLDEIIARNPCKYTRSSQGRCKYFFNPDLKKTFNRGYTDYFLNGRNANITSFDTPKAVGEPVGVVKETRNIMNGGERGASIVVAGVSAFANGDGLCFFNDNRELVGFRVNRVEGNRLHLLRMPDGLHKGMKLYRNHDAAFSKLLEGKTAERRIGLSMTLTTEGDYGFTLVATTETGRKESIRLDMEREPAKKNQKENITLQLQKLGNTPFVCDNVKIENNADNYFIPSSILSDARRRLIEKLLAGKKPLAQHLYENLKAELTDTTDACEPVEDASHMNARNPRLLMQCRHCLRFSLGCCVKNGGHKPRWKEPLRLELADGRTFPLEFDCRHCQMNVYSEEIKR